MNGLERIIGKIEEDAESVSATVISEAEDKAREIISEAESLGDAEAKDIISAAHEECAAMVRRAHSGGELQKKKALLAKKVEIIDGVISKAVKNFLCEDPDKYFDSLLRLVSKYALSGEQTMVLSVKDHGRMPKDFERRVNDAANGGKVKIEGGGSFDGGFLLVGDEVVQNCTVDALISDAETEIRDELYKLLFTE
ncbi:MAG: hypothetical protein E7578_04505 [Ruminococcaceae bacterium]|nr:hypothetical protein [Oscillospiraceae bacterium]